MGYYQGRLLIYFHKIGFTRRWAFFWDNYIGNLNSANIILTDSDERLVWDWNKQIGKVRAKKYYDATINSLFQAEKCLWYKKLWNWNIPLKLKCFFGC